jgi:hypothetical protein
VLKVNFIELLPIVSCLFLTPLAKSALHEFACLFYAEKWAKETKSDPSYVSSSIQKLEIVLQAMPEVQERQGFKTLRNNPTMDLEKNIMCSSLMTLMSKPREKDIMPPSANGYVGWPKRSLHSMVSTTTIKMSQ